MNADRLEEVLTKFEKGGCNDDNVEDNEIEHCRDMGWITPLGNIDNGRTDCWVLTPAGQDKLWELRHDRVPQSCP